jgi:hypothetical protein
MFFRLSLISTFIILLTLPALAAEDPCVYVSTFSGHQILCVDRTSGAVTVKVTAQGANFNPRDLVTGPDGNLYITDTDRQIWRFDPTQSEGPGNPSLVATLPGTFGTPESVGFSGSDNLYVTALGGKPVRIANATTSPSAPTELSVSSANWAGIGFGIPGNLLLVNQSQNQVFSSALPASEPYTTASSLNLTGLTSPVGLAVNTCGDIMVASGNSIKRFSGAASPTTYVSFPTGDVVRYFEFTSDNIAYVVTSKDDSGSRGKVWKILPAVPAGGEAISSCASGIAPTNPLVSLKDVSTGQNAIAATDQAIGIALPATNAVLTRNFGAGPDGVCGTGDDSLASTTNSFNFGQHSFQVHFSTILHCFPLTITAVMSKPSEVDSDPADRDFDPAVFPAGTKGMRYSSKGGFVIQYQTTHLTPDVDYVVPANDSAYQIKIGYFTLDQFQTPGLAKGADIGFYTEDISHDFWPSGAPGTDPEDGGEADTWSGFVVFNTPLTLGTQCGTPIINSPVPSGVHPTFKQGQTIAVKFVCSNGSVPNLLARLSIAKISPTFETQTVVSKNNQNVDNIFSTGSGGQYTYNVDSSVLALGTHQFTIFSNAFAPLSFVIDVIP